MPAGGDDSDSNDGADYTLRDSDNSDAGPKKDGKKKGKKRSSSHASSADPAGKSPSQDNLKGKKDDSDSDSGPRGGHGGGGGGGRPEHTDVDAMKWGTCLNILMIVTLGLSLLLMIIITATQSWGIGKYLEHDFGLGLFSVCIGAGGSDVCTGWDEFCPDGSGNAGAAGIFCIVCILILFVMFVFQIVWYKCPEKLGVFPKVQMILGWVLWFCLLLAWALFTGVKWMDCHLIDLGEENQVEGGVFFYAWGWFFVLWIWLWHFFTAITVTLKVLNKPTPCGM